RHEGTHVGRLQRGELLERWRTAQMLGQELQELQNVAPIGLDRLRRHAPLGGQIGEPAVDHGRDAAGQEVWFVRGLHWPLVPAEAGTQLLDSRFRGNERIMYGPAFTLP